EDGPLRLRSLSSSSISTASSQVISKPSSIASSKHNLYADESRYWYGSLSSHSPVALNRTPMTSRSSLPLRPRSLREIAGESFQKLPKEVLACILEQLKHIHNHPSMSCATCYLRDMHSVSLTSNAWY